MSGLEELDAAMVVLSALADQLEVLYAQRARRSDQRTPRPPVR